MILTYLILVSYARFLYNRNCKILPDSVLRPNGNEISMICYDPQKGLHEMMNKKNPLRLLTATAVLTCSLLFAFPAAAAEIRTPAADGTVTFKSGNVLVDASHTSDGYVMVKYTGKAPRIKVRIRKDTEYTYDLNTSGNFETFPLTEGNGDYTILVYENVGGSMYSTALSQTFSVSLSDPNIPFLYPNQFCNFSSDSAAVGKSNELVAGSTDTLQKVSNVYNFAVDNITYDYDKAATVQSGYLPVIDSTLSTKTGICFDYAALMTAMLRAQSIPTKLVIGYAGSTYHAWISVYTEEQGWVDNIIRFDGNAWKYMDPTFAASGKGNQAVSDFITNPANYQARFSY